MWLYQTVVALHRVAYLLYTRLRAKIATCYDDVFTTFHADIPDGKWFLQETLLRCAGLGASVQVSGQKLWRFRGIYQLTSVNGLTCYL